MPDSLLRREVCQADLVIGDLTPRSLMSAYVMFDLGARWGTGQHLIPVYAGGTTKEQVPRPLNLFTPRSLDESAQVECLFSDIAKFLGRDDAAKYISERSIEMQDDIQKIVSEANDLLRIDKKRKIS